MKHWRIDIYWRQKGEGHWFCRKNEFGFEPFWCLHLGRLAFEFERIS